MSQELIYTSAPRGLKPGSAGFCTVIQTQGMAAQLTARLEALSGYRQVFAPQDPQAALNPVVYSHLRIAMAGKSYHVLSRIAAAGLDYSQRTNKFAHHVAIEPTELVAAGPASLLALPGFMQSAWDGQPKVLPSGRRIPNCNAQLGICRAWQQQTGDAGWGGVLAESVLNNPPANVTLIYPLGLEPLPLIVESLALLSPQQRWGVTFSTYFTKLPTGVDCNWRCVLQGSPEAKAPTGKVIDLCQALGPAAGGSLVDAARTGIVPAGPVAAKVPGRSIQAQRPGDDELAKLLADPANPRPMGNTASIGPPMAEPVDYGLSPPIPPRPIAGYSSAAPLFSKRTFRQKEKSKLPMILGTAAALLVIGGGGIALMVAMQGGKDVAQKSGSDGPAPGRTPDSAAPPATAKRQNSGSQDTTATNTPRPDEKPSKKPTHGDKSATTAATGNAHPGKAASGNTGAGDKTAGDTSPGKTISAEKPHDNNPHTTAPQATNDLVTAVPAKKPSPTEERSARPSPLDSRMLPKQPQFAQPQKAESLGIELAGGETLKLIDFTITGGRRFKLTPREQRNPTHWDVSLELPDSPLLQPERVGAFFLSGNALAYEWQEKKNLSGIASAAQLRNCILEVGNAGSRSDSPSFFSLRAPVNAPPIDFDREFASPADAKEYAIPTVSFDELPAGKMLAVGFLGLPGFMVEEEHKKPNSNFAIIAANYHLLFNIRMSVGSRNPSMSADFEGICLDWMPDPDLLPSDQIKVTGEPSPIGPMKLQELATRKSTDPAFDSTKATKQNSESEDHFKNRKSELDSTKHKWEMRKKTADDIVTAIRTMTQSKWGYYIYFTLDGVHRVAVASFNAHGGELNSASDR